MTVAALFYELLIARFNSKPQHAPAKAKPIQYGAKIQVEEKDTTPELSPAGIKRIQDVVGTFAWYSRAATQQ